LLLSVFCLSTVGADEVLVKTFPIDASILVERSDGSRYRLAGSVAENAGAGEWRIIRTFPNDRFLILQAPGYREKRIYLAESHALRIEERLEPASGHLSLVEELPTGPSPKAVAFLPDGRMVVTQLRGPGIDVYDSEGIRRPISIPPGSDGTGFVEFAVLPGRGELWVSQMTTDQVHRLRLSDLSYISSSPTGGSWPKVLLGTEDESLLYVSNWDGMNVGVIDTESGILINSIPVSGQPRGMALSDEDRFLWVCLYSTGDVDIIDLDAGRVVDQIDLPDGAARHIVNNPSDTRMYLSDMYRGTVSIIDGATREVTASRRIGSNINTIALSPDGRFLYVSERGRNNPENYLLRGPVFGRLIVLDATDLSTVQEVWGRHQPTGLAVSPDGMLIAGTDFLDDNLAVFMRRR